MLFFTLKSVVPVPLNLLPICCLTQESRHVIYQLRFSVLIMFLNPLTVPDSWTKARAPKFAEVWCFLNNKSQSSSCKKKLRPFLLEGGALRRTPELWFLEICEAKKSGIHDSKRYPWDCLDEGGFKSSIERFLFESCSHKTHNLPRYNPKWVWSVGFRV